MKVITKMELKPGMVLGEDIVYQDQVIFAADTVMDEKMIERVGRYSSVMCVTVKEEVDFASTHYEKIRFDQRFQEFAKRHGECLMRYKGVMLSFLGTKQAIFDSVLMQIYYDVAEKISGGAELLDFLYNMMPNEDELTYTQGLNAALLAGAFADWILMSEEDKKILILSGFYYDIKWTLPYDILWKPGKLTEEEYRRVKDHPVIGYSIVRNDYNLNEHVKNAVIMHHERFDGSGYPYHMKGTRIDLFARYIAIVDTYIAMASPRVYRPAFTPLQILENFEMSLDKYDIELLMPLMKRIADAQIGTHVQLSDDSVWEVLIIQQNKLSRPILRNESNQILDLNMRPELKIVKNV